MGRTWSRWSLPAGVWLLGTVSLLNDVASEAIYPLLPFFVTAVLGATALSLGLIEGAAEAVNSLVKLASGTLSDRLPRRKPLVAGGYTLSALARPFISAAGSWVAVFVLRFVDRVGKGIRTAPRDALLAELADSTNRGRVFGFHRAMDHAGAIIGPLLATIFLLAFPQRYRTLFALTAIPGLATVVLLLWFKEDPRSTPGARRHENPPHLSSAMPRERLPSELKRYLFVLSVFTLGNSADAFLLLRLTDAAGGPLYIPALWSLLHVVKVCASLVGGPASDRLGRRPLIVAGWMVYAGVYAGFALANSLIALIVCFLTYGIYYGAVEGAERALVADLAPAGQKGTAFGVYNAVAGIGALMSSVLFGFLWSHFGSAVAFSSGAALAILAAVLLFALVPSNQEPSNQELRTEN